MHRPLGRRSHRPLSRTETAITTIAHPASRRVIVGVDTHGDLDVACALDQLGRRLAIADFGTTPTGYGAVPEWATRLGEVQAFGVEGCGCYGAGLARFLTGQGRLVLEVNRPDRSARRRRGKSDPVDAEAAARAVLADQVTAIPKTGSPWWKLVRCLRVARTTAVKACSQAINALRALVVTAAAELREQLRELPASRLAATAAQLKPGPILTSTAATKLALRLLGERCAALDAELARLDAELDHLTLNSEAAFSMLCGASPIPAFSGKTVRHRLNRGGNRQANTALYRIVVVRLRWHQPTRDYLARRTTEGLSKREITRCLKRYVAREVFAALHPPTALASTA
jgi:transposase